MERAFSKLGIASRGEARKWILEGRVRVNGRVVSDPGFAVKPETARLEVDGEIRRVGGDRVIVVVFHKPRGLVTTRSDEKNRPTVFDALPEKYRRLVAVGRLDLATSGLLLFTNDSQLAHRLTDPANEVPRKYVVTVRGRVADETVAELRRGVVVKGERFNVGELVLRKASGRESHLTIVLTEGKNREVRRLFLSRGHEVTSLKRVSFGGLELGDLKPGDCRELTPAEIEKLPV